MSISSSSSPLLFSGCFLLVSSSSEILGSFFYLGLNVETAEPHTEWFLCLTSFGNSLDFMAAKRDDGVRYLFLDFLSDCSYRIAIGSLRPGMTNTFGLWAGALSWNLTFLAALDKFEPIGLILLLSYPVCSFIFYFFLFNIIINPL